MTGLYGTYKNRTDPNCTCEFEINGIMTEYPTEYTIHNPLCPVHKLEIIDICKCETIMYEGKDCYENTVTYTQRNTNTCTMHNGKNEYVRTDEGLFFNGWDKRAKKK